VLSGFVRGRNHSAIAKSEAATQTAVSFRTDSMGLKHRLLMLATAALCVGHLSAAEVMVFAASSLSDALKEIAAAYQKQTGTTIRLNFGASSLLARQIEEGAPADVFFSADEAKMDLLEQKGLVEKRRSLLSNSLVIVVAAEKGATVHSPEDLAGPGIRRVALGDPRAVPIGIYAKEYLSQLGLWKKIEPKVVVTENVRAALAAVEAGNADASMVYKTDAAISRKVKVAFEVPPRAGPKISYPAALVAESKHKEIANAFLDYLTSPKGAEVFKKFGFLVLETSR
jgi:molybdate transport system substrate-binding protein